MLRRPQNPTRFSLKPTRFHTTKDYWTPNPICSLIWTADAENNPGLSPGYPHSSSKFSKPWTGVLGYFQPSLRDLILIGVLSPARQGWGLSITQSSDVGAAPAVSYDTAMV
jgi:hypothetical protein